MLKDNKKYVVLSIIAIAIIVVAAIIIGRVTYSFVEPMIDELETAQGEVTAAGNTLVFTKGNDLGIDVSTDNFNSSSGNLERTSNPKVKLIPADPEDEPTETYNVGFYILTNTFQYSQTGNPELILYIEDEANEILSITNGEETINRISITDPNNSSKTITGFDITGKTGLFMVSTNHEISSNVKAGTTQEWTFKLTFVNYSYDQSVNEDAELSIQIFMQKDEIAYHQYCDDESMACEIAILSTTNNHIYYHDKNLENGAEDKSYRYSGSNSTVNDNYVCFGYNKATAADSNSNGIPDLCESGTFSATSDYAYRIIGVFKDVDGNSNDTYYVKLIKATSYGSYHWDNESSTDSNKSNIFANSQLFSTTLNGANSSYLATLTTNKWNEPNNSYIAQPKWYVGGNIWANVGQKQASVAYTNERTDTNTVNTTYKIGLMYPSDYGFATSNSYWTTQLQSYNSAAKDYDWLWYGSGTYEWTIFRNSDNTSSVFTVSSDGHGGGYYANNSNVVRPVLYLSSSVKATGTGTLESPYILDMQST